MSETTAEYRVNTSTTDNTAQKMFASLGLENLKRAVLMALVEADDEWIMPKEVMKRLGIPPVCPQVGKHDKNALMYGVLGYLVNDGYVAYQIDAGGHHKSWRITEKGRETLKGRVW